jgi:hypothetical protein
MCVPGSVATLTGSALTPGTKVWAGGSSPRVLSASWNRVDFLCPAGPQEGTLEVAVNSMYATLAGTAPRLMTVEGIPGREQARAWRSMPEVPAALPTFWHDGAPAVAGGRLAIAVTGIACDGPLPRLRAGHQYASVVGLHAGLETGECTLTVLLPGSVYGNSVTLVLETIDAAGRTIESNPAVVAIEPKTSGS